jgi:hypothetical protein
MTSADGGVYAYGDAGFYGTAHTYDPNFPIIGIERAADDTGYWQVAIDGGVFSFGSAQFHGSAVDDSAYPVLGLTRTATGDGYWMFAIDGGVFSYGDAAGKFYGSAASLGDDLQAPILAFARSGPDAS